MGMHQGLDLSRFKKVGGDKKTTVLRHAKGHEIRIAHTGLTPKMREQLDMLPVHMAEGGEAPKPMDDASPAPAQDTPAAAPEADITADPYGDAQKPWADEDSGIPPPPNQPVDDNAPADVTITGERPGQVSPQAMSAPETAADRDAHDALFYQDLKNGHITPDTYQSLFAKKDTLGKIGTLFGMLLSGAGSGLAHQPNMVMDMMNKQIQNDLDAQKATKEYTKNFYQLSLQHELQKVQVPLMQAQADLAKAQATKVPSEIQEAKARINQLNAQAEYTASNSALNYKRLAALHSLETSTGKAPPGTQAAAAPALGALTNSIRAENSANNAKSAAAMAPAAPPIAAGEAPPPATGAAPAAPPSPTSPSGRAPQAIDWKKFGLLKQHGQIAESLSLPGGMRAADVAPAKEEAQRSQAIANAASMYDQAFKKLDSMTLASKLNKSEYDAQTALLKPEISKMLVGHFNESEANSIVNGMFPAWEDWGGARADKYANTMRVLGDQYNNTPTLNELDVKGLKAPWPSYKAPGAKDKGADAPKETKRDAQGVLREKVVKPDGTVVFRKVK